MKLLPGGRLFVRFWFYLLMGTVIVINLATLLSSDFLKYRRGAKTLSDVSSENPSHKVPSKNESNNKISYKKFEPKHKKFSPSKAKSEEVISTSKVSEKNFYQKIPNVVLYDFVEGVKNSQRKFEISERNNIGNKKDFVKDNFSIRNENAPRKNIPKVVQNLRQSKKKSKNSINREVRNDTQPVQKLAEESSKLMNTETFNHPNLTSDFANKTRLQPEAKKSTQNKTQSKPSSHLVRESNNPNTETNRNANHTKILDLDLDRREKVVGSKSAILPKNKKEQNLQTAVKNVRRSRGDKNGTRWNTSRTIECLQFPLVLVGRIEPVTTTKSLSQLEAEFNWLSKGGHYSPPSCLPKEKTAIIFPFRDRHKHLHILLQNLLPLLKKQNIEFTIFVIEQEKPSLFNRALLFNVGFVEALKHGNFDCFIFHDVDLIPLFDTNFYHCNGSPTHFLGSVDKFNYGLPYEKLFGGVVAFTRGQYERINGASNMYFGWGAEDDDLRERIRASNMTILRTDNSVGLYDMVKHTREKSNPTNPIRSWLLKSSVKRLKLDGLNSLEYERISVQGLPLYTWIKVKVNPQQIVLKSKYFTSHQAHGKILQAVADSNENRGRNLTQTLTTKSNHD